MAGNKKYGARGRKEFVRTRVPTAEKVAGAAILLVLVVIALSIQRKGKNFDPNRYAVRTESLKSTAAPVEGKNVTAPPTPAAAPGPADSPRPAAQNPPAEGENSGGGEGENAAPTSKIILKQEPLDLSLPGTKPMSDTEFYTSDNLFEKIDGRAPAYQDYHVQQLRCRSFAVTGATGSYVDVYEFRFDNPVDAFGMFSKERDPKGQPLDFAPDGYSGEMGYFFRQGVVYVQIIASDQKAETLALAKAIAQNRATTLPADDTGLAARRKLPADGLIASSISYVPEDAQGQAALKDVFQARYNFNGAELPFFIMATTPDAAAGAWQSFQGFCKKFGQAEALPDVDGGRIFRAQVFGKWKVIFQRDGEIGGTYDATDLAQAQLFVEKYLHGELK